MGRFRFGQATSASAAASDSLKATRFGSRPVLVEHEVDSAEVTNGTVVSGALVWLALDRIEDDYAVFVQLIGPKGLAKHIDLPPRNGSYPASWWDSDDLVTDTFEIPIDGLAPDEYALRVGVYEPRPGQRLPTASGDFAESIRVTVVDWVAATRSLPPKLDPSACTARPRRYARD